MRTMRCLVLFLTFSLLVSSVAYGQRERRRQFVENLLEGLIESQLDDRPRVPGQIQPGQTTRPVRVPPEVQAARAELEHISIGMRNLVSILQHESYTSPGYRQPLAEAMHIQAMGDALYRNSAAAVDMQFLIAGYTPMDQAWRSLAHRLRQARGISRTVLAMVEEVDQHTTEMVRLLGVQPQLNREELIRLSSILSTEFRHLLDDISYELQGHPRQYRFISSGRDLMTRIRQSTALIDRDDYDSIVAAWQQGQAGWRAYAAELRQIGNDRIRRDLARIEQTGRQINAALWLEVPVDRTDIANLVASVNHDIAHIMEAITLRDLLASPDANRLLATASELQRSSGSLQQSVDSAESVDDLVWDYRVLKVSWRDLLDQGNSIDNPRVRRHLTTVTESMDLLEQSLGGGLQLTSGEIQQMISRLGDLCNRTARFVNRDITPATHYDVRLRNDIRQAAGGMQNAVRNLHTNMTSRQPEQVLRKDLEVAITHWDRLKQLMNQGREPDRRTFHQLRGQMEPLFVKMQVVYSR